MQELINKSTTTDASGNFVLELPAAENYTISAVQIGYAKAQPITVKITPQADQKN